MIWNLLSFSIVELEHDPVEIGEYKSKSTAPRSASKTICEVSNDFCSAEGEETNDRRAIDLRNLLHSWTVHVVSFLREVE